MLNGNPNAIIMVEDILTYTHLFTYLTNAY